jgi:osmotically-inducible protein OsmY
MPRLIVVLVLSFAGALLSGCAAVVVGGAAATVAVAHDRRTMGTFVEDQNIYFKAVGIRQGNADISEQANIEVTVYNLQVLLTGQAASDAVSRRFANLVAQIPNVRKVYNEVQTAAEATWTDAADDMYLTSKVKLALFDVDIEDFDPTRVQVTTSQDTVYLMGLLTRGEAQAVTDQVRYLSGVQRVVTLFEYLPDA